MTLQPFPVPRDLPLPLPVSEDLLKLLIVPVFLAHILFVNLTIGASLLTVLLEGVGFHQRRFDALARSIAGSITINKSLAVVLGIAPLLVISLLYTVQFYAANTLTGHAWVMLVPLITAAFLLSYLHKYSWRTWTGRHKGFHFLAGCGAALLFLTIPLVFLSNINLMLYPESWQAVSGFFDSLRVGNVFPRYFHFVTSSIAVTCLFLAGLYGRWGVEVEGFTKAELTRHFYKWTLFASLSQLVFGPLLLVTLPPGFLSRDLLVVLTGAIAAACAAFYLLINEISAKDELIGLHFWRIVACLALTVLGMGYGRHEVRETALAAHKEAVAWRSREFQAEELAVKMVLDSGRDLSAPRTGQEVFETVCNNCHELDYVRKAPTLREIAEIYADNPGGIVKWARKPGKKRSGFEQMPAMDAVTDKELLEAAKHMLSLVKQKRN